MGNPNRPVQSDFGQQKNPSIPFDFVPQKYPIVGDMRVPGLGILNCYQFQ